MMHFTHTHTHTKVRTMTQLEFLVKCINWKKFHHFQKNKNSKRDSSLQVQSFPKISPQINELTCSGVGPDGATWVSKGNHCIPGMWLVHLHHLAQGWLILLALPLLQPGISFLVLFSILFEMIFRVEIL